MQGAGVGGQLAEVGRGGGPVVQGDGCLGTVVEGFGAEFRCQVAPGQEGGGGSDGGGVILKEPGAAQVAGLSKPAAFGRGGLGLQLPVVGTGGVILLAVEQHLAAHQQGLLGVGAVGILQQLARMEQDGVLVALLAGDGAEVVVRPQAEGAVGIALQVAGETFLGGYDVALHVDAFGGGVGQ